MSNQDIDELHDKTNYLLASVIFFFLMVVTFFVWLDNSDSKIINRIDNFEKRVDLEAEGWVKECTVEVQEKKQIDIWQEKDCAYLCYLKDLGSCSSCFDSFKGGSNGYITAVNVSRCTKETLVRYLN